jgi:chromosome segregation ATPase
MSAPETPGRSDPHDQTAHKTPWGLIAVAGVLLAGVIGLGIYALNLDSDLDDANAQLDSQQKQIDQAQDTGGDVVATAKSAYDDLTAQLGAAQDDAAQAVEQSSADLDQAEQAAEAAKGTAEELQKEADAAQAKAETASTCAQSFLSAFSGVFDGDTLKEGVEATVEELKALQPQCAPALEQG